MAITKAASRALLLLLAASLSAHAVADTRGHAVTLWMAEGASNRVYLLGSVHLLRKQDHPLPSVIDTVYDDAEVLFMEVDMDDLDPIAMQAAVNRLGVLDDDRTLRDLIGEQHYAEALESATALDIPLARLDKTEPWLAAITVEQLALSRIGFNPLYGIEMHMLGKARGDGKEIHGFESVDEQLQFLDGLSMEAQTELLMQTLAESENIERIMDDLIEAWRNGDVAYLEENLLADVAEYRELYDTIVVDRNRRWAHSIGELLDDDDDYLVIVGALHLVGNDGVPQLLARKGITISQMRQSGD